MERGGHPHPVVGRQDGRDGRAVVRVDLTLQMEQAGRAVGGDPLPRGFHVRTLVRVGGAGEDGQLTVVSSCGDGVVRVLRGVGVDVEAGRNQGDRQQQAAQQDLDVSRALRVPRPSPRPPDGAVHDHGADCSRRSPKATAAASRPAIFTAPRADRSEEERR